MSDDLRIYSGRQGQQQDDDPRQRRAAALQRFKQGHKSGELVTGIFLNLEPSAPGTAWVSLEGAALLAALPEDLSALAKRIAAGQGAGAMPTGVTDKDFPIKRGQSCYFILEAIEPEPVLRMLSAGSNSNSVAELRQAAAKARWFSILRLPLTQLAARYTQHCIHLENLSQQMLWTKADLSIEFPSLLPEELSKLSATHIAENSTLQKRYTAFVQEHEDTQQNFAELELYREALLSNLQPHGLLGLFFVPWLCPAARGLDLAFYRPAQSPTTNMNPTALQDVNFKLQGVFDAIDAQSSRQKRLELFGTLGGRQLLRIPPASEPDILQQILALKPEERRIAFSRKA